MNEVIGSFRVLTRLGEGDLGPVFQGRDLADTRDVVLLSLRPELALRADVVDAARAEAGMLTPLQHRNIAGLIGLVEDGGQCCLVREFVAGESLAERLRRRGALPWREAAGLVVQALRGLGEAHKARVIHRDITPANLLVATDGTLKLAGFGIAGILDKAGLTRTGSGVDALHYVSPEQVRGEPVDERSDLYLMAVVLYQALTGRVPFEHADEVQLIRAHLEQMPLPPSQHVRGLPIALESILMRALVKDARMRTPNALAFRRELEQLLESEPAADPRHDGVTLVVPSHQSASRQADTTVQTASSSDEARAAGIAPTMIVSRPSGLAAGDARPSDATYAAAIANTVVVRSPVASPASTDSTAEKAAGAAAPSDETYAAAIAQTIVVRRPVMEGAAGEPSAPRTTPVERTAADATAEASSIAPTLVIRRGEMVRSFDDAPAAGARTDDDAYSADYPPTIVIRRPVGASVPAPGARPADDPVPGEIPPTIAIRRNDAAPARVAVATHASKDEAGRDTREPPSAHVQSPAPSRWPLIAAIAIAVVVGAGYLGWLSAA